jgi:GTPase Era involved in 16S rRNA processing
MKKYYFERALFIVGKPNSGKSTQLKSMFRDVRFGTNSRIPPTRSIKEVYRLSNERALHIRRLMS